MRRIVLTAVAALAAGAARAQAPAETAPQKPQPKVEVRRFEFPGAQAGPSLGVAVKPLTDELREELNAKAEAGAVVASVAPGSAAAAAGIKPDDIITGIGGRPVKSPDDLRRLVREAKPGADVAVALERDGEKVTANATLRPAPGGFAFGGAAPLPEGFAFPAFDFGPLNVAFDQSKKVAELEKKVAGLEKRLAELEKKLDGAKK